MMPVRWTAKTVMILTAAMAVMAVPGHARFGEVANKEAEDQYIFATKLFDRKEYQRAADNYAKFVAKWPDHERAYMAQFRIGDCYLALHKDAEAAQAFQKVLDRYAEYDERGLARYRLGECHFRMGQYQQALTQYRQFVGQTKDDELVASGQYWIGECLYNLKRYDEALKEYRLVTTRYPKSPSAGYALYSIGVLEARRNRLPEAAASFRQAISRFPDGELAPECRWRLGECLLAQGKTKEAAAAYREVVVRHPDSRFAAPALYGLAWTQKQQGDARAAADTFARLVKDHPESDLVPEARLQQANALYEMGEYESAVPVYQQAAKGEDEFADDAEYWLGQSYAALKQTDKAVQTFRHLVQARPKSPFVCAARLGIADGLAGQGSVADAAAEYARVVKECRDESLLPQAYYGLGWCRLRQAKQAEGIAAFEKLIAAAPDSELAALASVEVGNHYLETKRAKQALTAFERALKRGEDADTAAPAHFGAARACEALQNDERAAHEYRAVIDKHPQHELVDDALHALGWFYLRHGKEREGRQLLQRLASEHADSPLAADGLLQMAERAYAADERDKALKLYRQAQERAGTDKSIAAAAQFGIGAVHFAAGDYAAARSAYEAALQSAEDTTMRAQVLYWLASSEQRLGETKQALAHFRELTTRHAGSEFAARAAYPIGLCLYEQKDYDGALKEFAEVVKSGGTQAAAAAYQVGWCHLDAGRQDEAVKAFKRMAERFPDHELAADAWFRVGEVEYQREEFAEAEVAYTEARKRLNAKSPLWDKVLYKLGWSLLEQKKETAAAVFESLVQDAPSSPLAPDALLRLGKQRLAKGDARGAAHALSRVVDEYPQADAEIRVRARAALGRCQRELGENSQALKTLQMALKGNPPAAVAVQVNFDLGRVQQQLKQHRAAIESYHAVTAATDSELAAEAQFRIGECLLETNDTEAAVDAFLRVVLLYAYPKWVSAAQFMVGQSYEKLGENDKAREAYAAVLKDYAETLWGPKARRRLAALGGE